MALLVGDAAVLWKRYIAERNVETPGWDWRGELGELHCRLTASLALSVVLLLHVLGHFASCPLLSFLHLRVFYSVLFPMVSW